MSLRSSKKAIMLTALTAMMWGTSFPAVSFGLRHGLTPLSFVFLRFSIASIPLFILALFRFNSFISCLKNMNCLILGLLNSASFITQFFAQEYISASLSALLINMSAIFTAILSAVVLKESFGKQKVTSVFLAFAGSFFVSTGASFNLSYTQFAGIFLALSSAIAWGYYIVLDKKEILESNIDFVSFSSWIVIIVSLVSLPLYLLFDFKTSFGSDAWFSIAYTSLVNTVIPYIVYQKGLEGISATTSSVILLLEPVVALLVSFMLLGERFDYLQLFGCFLVLYSIFLISRTDS